MFHEVEGPTSFEAFLTVDNHVCATCSEAFFKQGLLDDDTQLDATMSEASVSHSARCLLAILLRTSDIEHPLALWM